MLLTVTTNCTVVNSTVRNKLIDFRDRKLHFVNYRAKHILHTEIVKITRYFTPRLGSLCNLWPVSPCWHRAPAGAHCHTLLKRPELAAVFVVGLFLSLSLTRDADCIGFCLVQILNIFTVCWSKHSNISMLHSPLCRIHKVCFQYRSKWQFTVIIVGSWHSRL